MYSQNEEEKYILEAIGEQVGIFLDIGAYDGETRSNTLALVEREWWESWLSQALLLLILCFPPWREREVEIGKH